MRPSLQLLLLLLCHTSLFVSVTPEKVCQRPSLQDGSELAEGQFFFEPGTEVILTCIQGYTPTGGSRKIVCKSNGEWTERTLKCQPKRCPSPDSLENGQLHYQGITYKSTIRYSCNEGFILHGNEYSECLHTGQWSNPLPECKPVTCGLPDIPPFAKIVYDRRLEGHLTQFGFGGTYMCRPPFVLFGNERGICRADGSWTDPPECRLVTCPVPTSIENGFLSFAEVREYGYMETVKYGCRMPFVLDGPMESKCEDNGLWSTKPVCKGPCSVDINRGHILYRSNKIWIEDFKPNQILHAEQVAVYCLNKEKNCGYPVPTQCIDGKLRIPECFEEPSVAQYKLAPSSLPSEIDMCS